MSVREFACGDMFPALELPDVGPCCIGSAAMGPQHCTCWEPVYDTGQAEPVPGSLGMRTRMCHDCAYRPNSPEKRGEKGYQGDAETLDELVMNGELFVCHQGFRRVVKYVHPSGAEIPAHPADYAPSFIGGIPHKADGSPGDLCAGWSARRLHHMWREKDSHEASR